jgi:LysR family transcriptional regulator, low CO2-responsive transcriptional regulator
MNLRQLEVFLSVVEQGSFSGAAQESLLTQSTVSQHIAGLESELGVRVLERSRNGIRLTEAGKILLKHARHVVGELRATEDAIRRFRGLEETTLRIGVSTVPGTYLVPPILTQLSERFPRLHTVVIQGDSRDTGERIASRDVEAGVVGSRFEERGFAYTPIGKDQICLVAPPGHPWARRSSISAEDLYEGLFVMREVGSGTAKTVFDALEAGGVDAARLRVRAQIGGSEAVKAAVIASLGVSFLSEVVVRRDVDRGDLVIVPVDGLRITRPFYLARRSGRELSQTAAAFWDLMLATYGTSGTA